MKINNLLIIDFIIQLLFGVFFYSLFSEGQNSTLLIFAWVYLLCPFLMLIGILLLNSKFYIIGQWMIFITNIFFLPIGIIGFIGARKITDEIEQSKYE